MDKYLFGRENLGQYYQQVLAHKDLIRTPTISRLEQEKLFIDKREHSKADSRDLGYCARRCWNQLDSPMVSTGEDTCMFNCMRLTYDARGLLLERVNKT